ncbi:D-2-hydroxyacid dehydrogenase family protein [Nocardioides sp. cx-169]|uniref:D-2-hydroxyacid dehydrogenase family protein n=1 Tax=Nocardioides sp. cx-169 TaxID=2899080 RepID=UPI001E393D7C|nr:D-2-hydroxyacid dehydrogenase family protein [Nocardioides sp. cx-169]MCD4533527.1 D-2-hydroxyacid dehydrogenase family protein [Nocardioides sp. cx-169]
MRCVILDDYQGVATSYADWSVLGDVVVAPVTEHLEGEALLDALSGAEIAMVMRERTPLTRELLERLPDLRLVVTSGMRNASIDLAACVERGVVVCGTASSPAPAAELTWALILGLARHLEREAASLRAGGPWQLTVGRDLGGATLGVVGLGKIGSRVAQVGQTFGMEVVAWSPHLSDERAAEAGATRAESLSALMAAADVVTLHLVLSQSTRGLVGVAELAALRPHALLVNTSRAGLVDTGALLDALRGGRLAGAGLDVFDEEPLPLDHALRSMPQVLATPHLGYVTEANYRTFFSQGVEDIATWRAGEPVRRLG